MISLKDDSVKSNQNPKLYNAEALKTLQNAISTVYRKQKRDIMQSEALFSQLTGNLRLLENLHQLALKIMAGKGEVAHEFRRKLLSLVKRYPQANGSTTLLLSRVGAIRPLYLSLSASRPTLDNYHHKTRPYPETGLPCGGGLIANAEMATIYTAVVATHHFYQDSLTQPADDQLTQMLDTVTALSRGHGHLENLGSSFRQGGLGGLAETIAWEESSGNPVFYTPDPVNGNPQPIIDPDYLPDTPCELAREMCEGLLIDALNHSAPQQKIISSPDLTKNITSIEFPQGNCAGNTMIIRGHDFGFTQPDDVSIILPVKCVCKIVTVDPSNWSDSEITVTLPDGIASGLVGFYNTAKHVGYNSWVSQVNNDIKQINEVSHCLGTPLDIPQFGYITDNICPPDTGFNYIKAGLPTIRQFRVTTDAGTGIEKLALPGEQVTFFWDVENADEVQIVVSASNGQINQIEDILPTSATSFPQGVRIFSYTVKEYSQTTTLTCTLVTKNACGSSENERCNNNQVKITVHKPAQVFMTNMEVTQATQFLRADEHMTVPSAVRPDNSVALIQKKATLVRTYFATNQVSTFNNGTVTGVLVRLHGFRNGEELPVSPLSPMSEPLMANSDNSVAGQRGTLSRSANFRLPVEWTNEEGNITLQATLTLASDSNDTVDNTQDQFILEGLRFYAANPLKCILVRIDYTGETNPDFGISGINGSPSDAAAKRTLRNVRRMYPTSRVKIAYPPNPGDRVIEQYQPLTIENKFGTSGWGAVINQLVMLAISVVDDEDQIWCGVAHEDIPVFQKPDTSFISGVASGSRPFARGYAVFRAISDGAPAHEIGHAMDRSHHEDDPQWLTDGSGSSSQTDGISEYGIDVEKLDSADPTTVDTAQVFSPTNINDLMVSQKDGTLWISPYTYKKLMRDFLAPTAPTNAAPSSAGTAITTVSAKRQLLEHLVVQGVLFPHDERVELKPLYHMPRYPNQHKPQMEDSEYALVLVDDRDHTLYSVPIVDVRQRPIRREDQFGKRVESEVPFFAAMPMFPNTVALEIFRGRKRLMRVERPTNVPQLSKLTIHKDNKHWSLSWKAKHRDSLPLEYMVWITFDDGKRWYRIGNELRQPKFRFDLTELSGGNHCRLRVYASDGFNTTYSESDIFKIPIKPPIVTPLNFEDGGELPAGRPVLLEAAAISLRDGSLNPEQITWASNIQGALGTGEQIWVELQEGKHLLSIRGIEAQDCIGECTLSISVK